VSFTQIYNTIGICLTITSVICFASISYCFGSDKTNILSIKQEIKGAGSNRVASLDDLFIDNKTSSTKVSNQSFKQTSSWRGFSQYEMAFAYADPDHLSKMRLRTELENIRQINSFIKWKLSGRIDYDAVYSISNFYSHNVREDQRFEFWLRENYLDISRGNWDFRVGRQHIIWGEMVGLFFADVVSAKDMREFVLQDFNLLRIPQWALRTEYSKNNFHADLVWIPFATLDKIGRPGEPGRSAAEFYPFALPDQLQATFLNEDRSGRNITNSNYGLRLSQLVNGWDFSAFYYHSLDASPTFYLVGGELGRPVFQARHDRIDQVGSTFSKDLGSVVVKGEFVYTNGRQFNVTRFSQPFGLVQQDTVDYALGLDFSLPAEIRTNLQFFQRVFLGYDRDIFHDKWESGASIMLNRKLWQDVEVQTLLIHSLNRVEWMLRPRINWNFTKNWRLALGADMFEGPATGLFGRFANNDRIFTEIRLSF